MSNEEKSIRPNGYYSLLIPNFSLVAHQLE